MKKLPFAQLLSVLAGILLLASTVYIAILSVNAVKENRYIGRPDTERDTITITGEGRVTAIPDLGQITVSIVTEGRDAEEAQAQNIEKYNGLVNELKQSGIDSKDLKSTAYTVSPVYDWIEGVREFRGFEVRQSLQVKIRDLNNAGEVIRIASQNGVNEVSGLSFTIDEPESYRQLAREEALANAREKAQELADLTGVSLGKIVSFSESSAGVPQPMYRLDFAQAEKALDSAAPAPEFEAGSEEVVVIATIEYEIY